MVVQEHSNVNVMHHHHIFAMNTYIVSFNIIIEKKKMEEGRGVYRGERERLFSSREGEGKLKITYPFYRKGMGIRKCYGKGREWEI